MSELGISMDELLAEMTRLHGRSRSGPAGFTMADLADKLGVSLSAAQRRVREMARLGLIRCAGKREGLRVDGVRCLAPVYVAVRATVAQESRRK